MSEPQYDELREAYLQLSAELHNYKERAERDRDQAYRAGMENVYLALLPVLDGFASAAGHGDLDKVPEGISSLIAALGMTLERHGLQEYAEVGDTFDPEIHEAVQMKKNPEATEVTISEVIQRGYATNQGVLRAAKVEVTGK